MRWPAWLSAALTTPSSGRKRRRRLSNAERRKRDEQFIPLEVGRLEDRRVLSGLPTPTLTTSPSPASVTLTSKVQTLKDTATLAGGNNPTGKITFTLYQGNSLVDTETATVHGNGSYNTPTGYTLPTSGTVTGNYQWDATYSGDTNNNPASDSSDPPVSPASPTISTSVTTAEEVVGGAALQDTATLSSGFNETGTATFNLYSSSTTQDSSTQVYTENVAANGNSQVGTTTGWVPTAPGTYYWVASYGGDSNNNPVASGASDEPEIVDQASPTISTSVTTAEEVVGGAALQDTATLSGGHNATGTVTFNLYSSSTTQDSSTQVYTEAVAANGNNQVSTSTGWVPTAPGTYYWVASYGGDSNNNPVASGASSEPEIVDQASPTISTSVTTAEEVVGGAALQDTATLSNGFSETGTVTFNLYSSSTTQDSSTQVYTENVTPNGNNQISTSTGWVPTAPGTYYWVASYGGDTNNKPVASGASSEPEIVDQASPTISTSVTTAEEVVGGAALQDTATLSNGFSETGTVTFNLYSSSTTQDSSTQVYTENVTANGNNQISTSTGWVPTTPGTYYWVASYGGDSNNNAVASGASDEPEIVDQASPTIVTTASAGGVLGVASVHDTATLSGGYAETGNIDFTLDNASGVTVFTDTESANGNSAVQSKSFTPTVAGAYTWSATYAGDGNNNGPITASSAGESVTILSPLVISGTAATTIPDTALPITPFSGTMNPDSSPPNITITDNFDANDTLDIEVVANANVPGTLSIPNFTKVNSKEWTFRGTALDATTDLQEATFTPARVKQGTSVAVTFTVEATDPSDRSANASARDSGTVVTVNGFTQPPMLTGANPLITILENTTASDDTPTPVSQLIAGDAMGANGDPVGIAVIGADTSIGTWYYSTDGGTIWTALPASLGTSQAVLLASGADDLVEFVPNSGKAGIAGLTFYAWDTLSGGTDGETGVDLTTNPPPVLVSTNTETSTITVLQPLIISGTAPTGIQDTSGPITPFASTTATTPNVSITDNRNPSEQVTVTVTPSGTAQGTLTFPSAFTYDATNGIWTFTGAVGTAITDLCAITFAPNHVLLGASPTLTLTVTVSNSTLGDAATDAHTVVTVTGTTPQPILSGGNPVTAIVEGTTATADPGVTVASLLTAAPSNTNRDGLGIALTGSTTNSGGEWDYSTNGGTSWTALPAGLGSGAALLLGPADMVRFLPNSTYTGTASLTYYAWDTTSGGTDANPSALADVSGNPDKMVFSAAEATSTIPVIVAPTISSYVPLVGSPMTSSLTIVTPAGTAGGTALGTVTEDNSKFSFLSTLPTVSFAITSVNTGGLHIDPSTGQLTVINPAALVYSATPMTITVTASYQTSLTATPQTLAGSQTITLDVWQATVSATPIGASSSTTVTVGLQPAQPGVFQNLAVNFDDNQSAAVGTPQLGSYTFNHFYARNPGPTPASPIPISLTVTDVQGHSEVVQTRAVVDGTGITGAVVIVQTTSAAVLLTPAAVLAPVAQQTALDASTGQQADEGVAPSEVTASAGRQVLLRIVSPSGDEQQDNDFAVRDEDLNNLPGLFKKLPDGHYRIYLSEDGRQRLLMDVVVRGGRPTDPSQDTGGGEDRPPSSQIEYHQPALIASGAGKQCLPVPAGARSSGAMNPTSGVNDLPKTEVKLPMPVEKTPNANPGAPGPQPGDGAASRHHRKPMAGEAAWELAAAGVGLAAVGLEARPLEVDRVMARLGKRSLSKAARLGRRLRSAAGRSPT